MRASNLIRSYFGLPASPRADAQAAVDAFNDALRDRAPVRAVLVTEAKEEKLAFEGAAADLIDVDYCRKVASLHGRSIAGIPELLCWLLETDAQALRGWAPFFCPAWIFRELAARGFELDGANHFVDLLDLPLGKATISPHPALGTITSFHPTQTLADWLGAVPDKIDQAASLVDLKRYRMESGDLQSEPYTAAELFRHLWSEGIFSNRLFYLGSVSRPGSSFNEIFLDNLAAIYRAKLSSRLSYVEQPITATPRAPFLLVQDAGELERIDQVQPGVTGLPGLEDFHVARHAIGGNDPVLKRLPGIVSSGKSAARPIVTDRDLLENPRACSARRVIYSINIGLYDWFPTPPELDDCDYFMITDWLTVPDHLPWRIIRPTLMERDPKRLCLWYKSHPHRLFPNAEHAVWMDSNIDCLPGSERIIAAHEALSEVATFSHPDRQCVYAEATEIGVRKLERDETIASVVKRLKDEAMPENFGLYETNVLYSRLCDPRVRQFMDEWWRRIFLGSRRDQLSFTAAARATRTQITPLDGPCSARSSRYFDKRPHRRATGRFI